MRILHIITQKPFATGSGVYLSGIMAELGKDHDQYLICGLNDDHETGAPVSDDSVLVDPIMFNHGSLNFPVPGMSDVMPYPSSQYSKLTQPQGAQLIRAFLKKTQFAIASFQPDVIICQHLYLVTAALAHELKAIGSPTERIPIIGICHGSEIRQFRATDKWRDLIKAGISQLDGIIATHREQADEISGLYGVSKDKIRVLGSGFNDQIFNLNGAVTKTHPPIRIVFTGKLAKAKGVPELLSACDLLAKHHSIHLTLIGSGADPVEFEGILEMALAKDYPVVLTGQIEQTQIAEIYQRSHVLILPSYYEGMPLVVVEALACGLQVVVTNLPGFSTWLAPFTDQVRLIPRPQMVSLDEPTLLSRQKFILDIAKSAEELIGTMTGSGVPDLSEMTWQGLSQRIEAVLYELTQSKSKVP